MSGTVGRPLAAGDYLKLKAAFRRLVRLAGGMESAASCTRVAFQTLSRYGRPDDPNFAPADVVADLEADTGAAEITRVLAGLAGLILVPKPPAAGDPAMVGALGRFAKEAGEAMGRLGEALADDGKIGPDEIKRLRLRDEVREAMEALAEVDAILSGIESEARL